MAAEEPAATVASVTSHAISAAAEAVLPQDLDVRFERSAVTQIVHDPLEGSSYPDHIILEDRELPERCLGLEVTPDSLLARMPRRIEPAKARESVALRGTGKLLGKVVRRRRPKRGCEVRLTLLRRETFLSVFSQEAPTDHVLFVTTGKDGRFLFEDLPPGPHRLAFRPPGESDWLIRLRKVPVDAVLGPRESLDVGRIDLGKRRLS